MLHLEIEIGGFAMFKYGQVIEIYMYGDQTWVTVWDLKKGVQRAGFDSTAKLKIKDFVTFTGDNDTFLTNITKIEASALPHDLAPCI